MKKTTLLLPFFLLLLVASASRAEGFSAIKVNDAVLLEGNLHGNTVSTDQHFKIKAAASLSDEKEKEDENKHDDIDKDSEEQEDKYLAIDGTVSALTVSQNSFVVNNITIFIDASKVSQFHQLGILAVGSRVKVKVVRVDSKLYATDINVIGTGQGRFQIKEQNRFMTNVETILQHIADLLKQRLNFLSKVTI